MKGDEFWHMTKVLRLGINDRYGFHKALLISWLKVHHLDVLVVCD